MGIDELLNVTVSVENTEENSYNSHVILTYPPGLSYRKFTNLQVRRQDQICFSSSLVSCSLGSHSRSGIFYSFIIKGRIECNSLDSEDGLSRGKTDCTVDKPILKSNTKVWSLYRRICFFAADTVLHKEEAI